MQENPISLIIDNQRTEFGNLYLGNQKSLPLLEQYNIKCVLSLQKEIQLELPGIKNQVLHQLQLEDMATENISKYFDETYDFIEHNLQQQNVLVQCITAISSSSAFLIAYLIKKRNWDLYNAQDFLLQKRPTIQPNMGFMQQLEQYSQMYYPKNRESIDPVILNKGNHKQGNLFVGSINSIDFIQKCYIGAVVSLMTEFKPKIGVKHLYLVYGDMPKVQICKAFDETTNFIEENLQNTNVLVHCMGGVSRSTTIVIAYLIGKGMNFNEAFETVKKARPCTSPNEGFMNQLRKWEIQMKLGK